MNSVSKMIGWPDGVGKFDDYTLNIKCVQTY